MMKANEIASGSTKNNDWIITVTNKQEKNYCKSITLTANSPTILYVISTYFYKASLLAFVLCKFYWIPVNLTCQSVAQNQKAVAAYLKSKQLLPFGFAEQKLRSLVGKG